MIDIRENKFYKFLKNNIFPLSVAIIFLIISIILISHHEFWYDEIHSWDRAIDSHSISEFIINMRDSEGHPYFWSFLLFLASKFITKNVEIIKVINLSTSIVAVFLFSKFAPFKKIFNVFFVFGYFMFYEYSIISRNYSIGILFIIIFCVLFKNRYKNIIQISIILLLLAQTNLYCFMISVALSIYFIIDLINIYKIKENKNNYKYIIIAISIIILGWLLIYLQLGSQAITGNSEMAGASITSLKINENAAYLIPRGIISAFLPIPQINYNFWYTDTQLITKFLLNFKLRYTILLSALLLLLPILFLKRKVIILYLSGVSLMLLIPLLVYKGVLRHYGNILIFLIACLWISKIEQNKKCLIKGKSLKLLFNSYISIILIASIIGSSIAFYYDFKYPFSSGKEVAEYIENNFNKNKLIIVGFPINQTNVISAYLQKQIYYPELEQFGTYKQIVKNKEIENEYGVVDINSLFNQAKNLKIKNQQMTILVVVNKNFLADSNIPVKYGFSRINKNFEKSIVAYDDLELYVNNN